MAMKQPASSGITRTVHRTANGARPRRRTNNGAPREAGSRRVLRATARRPHHRFAWYGGLAIMAAFEIIEWPLALLMMIGHEIAHRAHNEALRDFAEGIEAGA
jgi:hypothetical protein